MTVGVDDVECSQIVSVAIEHSLYCHASNLQAELGILFKQVTRCAAERAWVGRSGLRKIDSQIEESGILRGGGPVPWVTTRLGQVKKNLPWVASRILPRYQAKGRKPCRGHVGGQGILLVSFGFSAGAKQYPFADRIDCRIGLIQSTRGFGICQGLFDMTFGEERLHSELTVGDRKSTRLNSS